MISGSNKLCTIAVNFNRANTELQSKATHRICKFIPILFHLMPKYIKKFSTEL